MTLTSLMSVITVLLAVLRCQSEHAGKDSVSQEKDHLQSALGEPIHDDDKVKKINGVRRTTTIHKICSKLRQISKHRSKDSKNIIKQRCGRILRKRNQQYNTQANKVAEVIQNSHQSHATLKQQREQLVREVNKLAKLAGPLPSLKSLKVAG